MAQATSPSMSLQDGHQDDHQHPQHIKSNSEVPVDPNIAASSPTYPPYSPYAPHDMSHYQGQPPPGYPPQHGWPQHHPGYHHGMPYSGPGSSASGTPASAGPRPGQVSDAHHSSITHRTQTSPQNPHPLSQVYSFVPIPGAQQHKRPRRRYEEIERMYKCGWQGCEKAYGTLNHLNAHVTMQSHGTKRTPEGMLHITLLVDAKSHFGLDHGSSLVHGSAVLVALQKHEPYEWVRHLLHFSLTLKWFGYMQASALVSLTM